MSAAYPTLNPISISSKLGHSHLESEHGCNSERGFSKIGGK